MKRTYYYLFYKFYKLGEWSPSIFPSDFTATLAITMLEIIFIATLKVYYNDVFDITGEINFFSYETLIPMLTVCVINYFAFINDTKWKKYFKEFDELTENRNDIGTAITIVLVVFLSVAFVISIEILKHKRRIG